MKELELREVLNNKMMTPAVTMFMAMKMIRRKNLKQKKPQPKVSILQFIYNIQISQSNQFQSVLILNNFSLINILSLTEEKPAKQLSKKERKALEDAEFEKLMGEVKIENTEEKK